MAMAYQLSLEEKNTQMAEILTRVTELGRSVEILTANTSQAAQHNLANLKELGRSVDMLTNNTNQAAENIQAGKNQLSL